MNRSIDNFFDKDSRRREDDFTNDPILRYEQEARQRTIGSLLDGEYRSILDAGCGNGRDFEMYLNHALTVTGIDSSPGMVEEATKKAKCLDKNKLKVLRGNVTQLPNEDGAFDLIVCSEVLEHVPEWKEALVEFHRSLASGGQLIVSTPNKFSAYGLTRYSARAILGSKHPYDRWKSYWELKKALEESGFEIIESRGGCYLPGDICYYQPIKALISPLLGGIGRLEKFMTNRKPFSLLGYSIAIKSQKVSRTER